MRIQHNIMAMNAYRNYNTNTSALSKNLEKLSSGYKINRAGDDAAGLAISEKMRAQITGLNAAQKNVKDGISLVKTAEGAMQEIQDMLNRMDYLATQSANGTYQDEVDRENLQKEVNQLLSEINRIADSSNFNGIKLLDGSLDSSMKLGKMSAVAVDAVADGEQSGAETTAGTYTFDLDGLEISAADDKVAMKVLTLGGKEFAEIKADGTLDSSKKLAFKDVKGDQTGADIAALLDGLGIELDGIVYKASVEGSKVTLTSENLPDDATKLTDDFSIVLTEGDDAAFINNGWDQSVHIETPAAVAGDNKLAQGEFTLTAADVKNGKALQIGKDVYVFQVGDDNPIEAGAGQTVIKLTAGQEDADLLKEATIKLSQQNNKEFHITTKGDGETMHLTEKPGAIKYKDVDYDLTGDDTDDANATWENVVKKGALTTGKANGKALQLQIGDTSDSYNQLKVSIGDMHSDALGLEGLNIGNPESAAAAIQTIKDAINKVSSVRGDLGATQNRLEHTANNLSVMAENIQDAESTIRDTDVAEEMMAYTKNNILIQSAQAMLAQANAVPQGVLQLLG